MSDPEIWETYAALRQIKQEKKRSNLAYSTGQLVRAGIAFESHNNDIHLVVKKGDETIDYWPSTGLWWIRGSRNKRRGMDKLIRHMKGKDQ